MSKKQDKFDLVKRVKSFQHALSGLKTLVKEEHNARIHLVLAILAVCLGYFLNINHSEWLAIVLCIVVVFATEILNSAIENIADYISPDVHPRIKIIKDYGAAAVLVVSAGAILVAGIIFLPRISQLL